MIAGLYRRRRFGFLQPAFEFVCRNFHRMSGKISPAVPNGDQFGGDADGYFGRCYCGDLKADGGMNLGQHFA